MRNYMVWGQWNVICDVCGLKKKSAMLRERWDSTMVCEDCFETRHPSDLQRVPRTEKSPPWTRPQPEEIEVSPDYVDSSVGVQE